MYIFKSLLHVSINLLSFIVKFSIILSLQYLHLSRIRLRGWKTFTRFFKIFMIPYDITLNK